jgi:hypothetical protein
MQKPTLLRLFKVLAFPLGERRQLLKILQQIPSEKVIRLRSNREVEAYLMRLGLHTDENSQSSPLHAKR